MTSAHTSLAVRALLMSAAFFAASGAEDTPTIIVVGGGLAGLSASAEALRHGANVVLFDKEANIGGNSAKATSGINGAHTHHQRMFGINDSTTQFINDTLKSGRGLCNQSLVETLAENSRDAIIFLETFQLDLSLLSQCGGHSAARTHREPNTPDGKPRPVGFDIVQALKRHLEAQDSSRFRFQLRSRVHELVTSQGNVIGVRYYQAETRESMTLLGDAVILTTGGFSFDRHGFMRQFAPTLASLPTTNGPWATGDGVRLAQAIGADTRDMEQVQVHPTAFVDPGNPLAAVKFLAPEALRGSGGVLLNRQGVRFVNELATRDTVVGAMYQYAALDTPFNGHASAEAALEAAKNVHEAMPRASEALLLLDQQAVNKFGLTAFNFYHKVKGFFQSVDGASGLIQYLTILTGSPANQQLVGQTLADLTAAANGAIPDTVGRTVFASNFTDALHSPLYVARVTGAIHYTMGGLRIDSTARVMRTTQQACSSTECDDEDDVVPIAGLYAAGEVTGGVHGANRLAGNSLLECVVFGRQAAVAAVTYSRSAPSSRSSY